MTLRLLAISGARPNFMKLAPLWHEVQTRQSTITLRLIHTGQHYDPILSTDLVQELNLPTPAAALQLHARDPATQFGEIIQKLVPLFQREEPDVVVVVGDVNSTAAAAIAANKCHLPVVHVEAGLRSFDRTMPEEINRLIVDQIADLALASEPSAMENLLCEGIAAQRCVLVGNLMIDCLAMHRERIERISLRELLVQAGVPAAIGHKQAYAVVTLHRPSNVDSAADLHDVASLLERMTTRLPILWPVHPRTMERLVRFELLQAFRAIDRLYLMQPLSYLNFMRLIHDAAWILTDSGGVQEESTFWRVPCLTMRANTERPFTLTHGTNRLTDRTEDSLRASLDWAADFDRAAFSPPDLWDGQAARRSVDAILARWGSR